MKQNTYRMAFMAVLGLLVVLAAVSVSPTRALAETTIHNELISINSAGIQGGDGLSFVPSISANGRYVAFCSQASDLLFPSVNPNNAQVYLRDAVAGTTTLISTSFGTSDAANGSSLTPSISADGRYIAYQSTASDIVTTSGTPLGYNVFLYDRNTGTTKLVNAQLGSVPPVQANGSSAGPTVSPNGAYVAYTSTATDVVSGGVVTGGHSLIFLYDVTTSTTKVVTTSFGSTAESNGDSYYPSFSSDGSLMTFISTSTDIVAPGRVASGNFNVYLIDTATGSSVRELVSTANGSTSEANNSSAFTSLDATGKYVAYESYASDIVGSGTGTPFQSNIYLYNVDTKVSSLLSKELNTNVQANGASTRPFVTSGGKYVTFASAATNLTASGSANDIRNVFRLDTATGLADIISTELSTQSEADGTSWAPVVSAAGDAIAYQSNSTNITDIPISPGIVNVFLAEIDTAQATHVMTFDPQNGSVATTQAVDAGAAAVRPADPTRSGYTFQGWFTAATGGTTWNFSTPVNEDTTLYAQWLANVVEPTPTPTPTPPAASNTGITAYASNQVDTADGVSPIIFALLSLAAGTTGIFLIKTRKRRVTAD